MLQNEFDPSEMAMIQPEALVPKNPDFPDVTISCFSKELFHSVLHGLEARLLDTLNPASGRKPIYEVWYQGKRFAFYQSFVGEPQCVMDYEELIAMGSQCLILLGNCGVLDRSIPDCGIILPTAAIRDEGCSYHYAPPGDTIPVNRKYMRLFEQLLERRQIPYVKGMTWTTDAIYRETREKAARRKAQGAICVEMECAGMQALCTFRHTDFFQFFYAGDNLDHPQWQPRSVAGRDRLEEKTKIAMLAFELGLAIQAEKVGNAV